MSLSLYTLLNCSYNPLNLQAFQFAETASELLPFIRSTVFDIAITAKFVLSCLSPCLDCDQLLALRLDEREASYCVATLATAVCSHDMTADGFSVHELLLILTNLTQPHSVPKKEMSPQSKHKGKKHQQKVKQPSEFDQQMLNALNELETNCQILMNHELLDILENTLQISDEKIQEASARVLWNLLHSEVVRTKVESEFADIRSCLFALCETSSPAVHLAAQNALWLVDVSDEKGSM